MVPPININIPNIQRVCSLLNLTADKETCSLLNLTADKETYSEYRNRSSKSIEMRYRNSNANLLVDEDFEIVILAMPFYWYIDERNSFSGILPVIS